MDDGLTLEKLEIAKDGRRMICLTAHVPPGQVLSVMGPSGAGKSTLLSALIGTLAPGFDLTGRVLLNGRDITALPPERRQIGILFQDELLFPHLSVGGNLGFGLPAGIRGRAARSARIETALADIGMPGYAARDPQTLSGGQKARVALMRVLLSHPRALLLDEPFSRLDAGLRAQIRDLVFARARAAGLPVLLVTHDEDDARAAGGPVIRLRR
ncbi:ABC transporter ATP-binding protein [Salipiger aestuarii]|uniref:Putative thiamine transport system ATP-binding protein n=1 Tax=Salipiger aestuarii TaxID=568098 RepID=A0A327YTU8_9RHOB|nr:ATP-binding cassette domain-containing protein [Salipiger aestuarii]EIE51130.1 ABC transporter-like protein [Citreicella sp. 357]KAB2543358.1 ABC transporter ATP-binding protein [Salipiger aestuarii]RAK23971.1 putative thiamine transport system ATP-binding protein [Salipiger aestuarii]